jgi:flagella basal body P-ring formation protein FlgA
MTRIAPDFRLPLIACLAAFGAAAVAAAEPASFQDIAQLEAAAKSAAAASLPPPTERQRLQVGPIQTGLRLARCESGVKPVIAPGLRERSRVLIELRCDGPSSWHIYVPVRVVGTSAVVMAAHAIVAGSVLKAGDLRVEEHDISDLPLGYMDDPAVVAGLTAGRPIPGGAYITNQLLVAPKAVQRGQTVTLVADTGGISIRMAGRALSDGLLNQRVKVTNLSSGKVVEGIARSEQVVEIILQ